MRIMSLFNRLARRALPCAGRVDFVGAGPGDPELLTLKALRVLNAADVVIHDRLVGPGVLKRIPGTARLIGVGKTGFGPSTPQGAINRLIVGHATAGQRVVRLKGGDPTVFGRLDEEIEACQAAGLDWSIVPGITAASATAAAIGQSLTRRERNTALRILTGHDMKGFADHDWRALAQPGAVAAIYMGKASARFIQGRLLMHGASRSTLVTLVENVSLPGERVVATTLDRFPADLDTAALDGPALILLGLAPRAAQAALPYISQEQELA